MNFEDFEVIVIGGGHAGIEACAAAARMGRKTLLVTHTLDTVGHMGCSPSIGGVGRSHLVKELDALGGIMARVVDKSGIVFRNLNSSKGEAVKSIRAQVDKYLYKRNILEALTAQDNLVIFQANVSSLLIEQGSVAGIQTLCGLVFYTKSLVISTGTFLGSSLHIGRNIFRGSRVAEDFPDTISEELQRLLGEPIELQTGTTPRLDSRTINYREFEEMPGDTPTPYFSDFSKGNEHPKQVSCFQGNVGLKTLDFIRGHIADAPSFKIDAVSTRYCSSIEEVIHKFPDLSERKIFLSPEGLNTSEVFTKFGLSLPVAVQMEAIRTIKGLEDARIMRPGYRVKYWAFDPRNLDRHLETKIPGLFFAGQINGTTGYAEAAAQGIIAGINASLKAINQPLLTLKRSESYIGVLIDDIVSKGVTEPFRMFTSRVEHRMHLREDNAVSRLSPKAIALGLLNAEDTKTVNGRIQQMTEEIFRLKHEKVSEEYRNKYQIFQTDVLYNLIAKNKIQDDQVFAIKGETDHETALLINAVKIQIKYEPYVAKHNEKWQKIIALEELEIPANINYDDLKHVLSTEVYTKLNQYKPKTLGEAYRIEGLTAAAISVLHAYIHRNKKSLSTTDILV